MAKLMVFRCCLLFLVVVSIFLNRSSSMSSENESPTIKDKVYFAKMLPMVKKEFTEKANALPAAEFFRDHGDFITRSIGKPIDLQKAPNEETRLKSRLTNTDHRGKLIQASTYYLRAAKFYGFLNKWNSFYKSEDFFENEIYCLRRANEVLEKAKQYR